MSTGVARKMNLANVNDFDLRSFPKDEQFFRVMQLFASTKTDDDFCVICDYEPSTLKRHFHAELEGRFEWHVLKNGPEIWEILIAKTSG